MGRSLAAGAAFAGASTCGDDKTGRSTRAPHGGSGFRFGLRVGRKDDGGASGGDGSRSLHGTLHRRAVPRSYRWLDRSGPELRSILETNEHALTLADELDRERRESSSPAAVASYPNVTVPAGWVHGLPISDPGAGEAGVRRDASRPLKNTSAACAVASCREPVSVMLVQACAEMIG